MTFHQRNSFPLNEVKLGTKRAKSQAEVILSYFEGHPDVKLSPFEVQSILLRVLTPNVPITSVRRALTDLTVSGHLVKYNVQVKGPYGVSNCVWGLAKDPAELF